MTNFNYKYNVFISYKRSEVDSFISGRIFKMFEAFKVPKKLRNEYVYDNTVFRDVEEMQLTGTLGELLEKNLNESRYLLIICSKNTYQSSWVEYEIRTFINSGKSNNIYMLITDDVDRMPKAIEDIDGFESKIYKLNYKKNKPNTKEIHETIVKLVSVFLNCSPCLLAEAIEDEKKAKRRKYTLAMFGISITLFVYCTLQLYLSNLSINKARFERQLMIEILENITYSSAYNFDSDNVIDKDKVFEMIANNQKIIDEALGSGLQSNDNNVALLTEKGATLSRLGDYEIAKGNFSHGIEYYKGALNIVVRMNEPNKGYSSGYNLSLIYLKFGYAYLENNDTNNSIAYLLKSVDTINNNYTDYGDILLVDYDFLGWNYKYQGQYDNAIYYFNGCIDLCDSFLGNNPYDDGNIDEKNMYQFYAEDCKKALNEIAEDKLKNK